MSLLSFQTRRILTFVVRLPVKMERHAKMTNAHVHRATQEPHVKQVVIIIITIIIIIVVDIVVVVDIIIIVINVVAWTVDSQP